MRALLEPLHLAMSVACDEAGVPFGGPGDASGELEPVAVGDPFAPFDGAPARFGACGFANVMFLSRTGAELPAASVTLTTR
jgi:hypothetical protein